MKKVPFLAGAGIILIVFSGTNLRAELRQWTRAADGKKIEAEFVAMKDEATVTIKMANGNSFDVPLTSLSPEDNEYVAGLSTKPEMKDSPASEEKPALPEGEVTLTLSGVHMCCGDCEEAIVAVKDHEEIKVDPAVTIATDRANGTVTVTAPDAKAAQTVLRAMLASGFYGVSDNEAVKIADLKEDDFTSDTMVVRDPHLCCRGCVKDFVKAVESVDGVEEVDAKEGSTRVKLSGKGFKPYEVMVALRAAGFGGTFQ